MAESATAIFKAFVTKYRDAPNEYVRKVYGVRPDKWQDEVLEAYGCGERQMSVASCHGPGKTCVVAWMLDHQQTCRYPQRAAVTAPSAPQLFDALYMEVLKWMRAKPAVWQDLYEVKADRIELKAAKERCYITFRTARRENPEALQGIHIDPGWVLIAGDEASGIDDAVFVAGRGSMSQQNAQVVLISNPTKLRGFFYDSQHRNAHRWKTWTVDHTMSTRVSEAFVEEMREEYGEESDEFRVRCLAQFPKADVDTILSREVVESAVGRDIAEVPGDPVSWGVDVGGGGRDPSCLVKRKGSVITELPMVKHEKDTMAVVAWVEEAIRETETLEDRPDEILVDAIGIGKGVADRLRQLGYPAKAINVGERAPIQHEERYRNLRTYLLYEMKEWFDSLTVTIPQGGSVKVRSQWIEEMVSQTRTLLSNGKVMADPKEKVKKELKRSPNMSDATMLTFAGRAAVMAGAPKWTEPIDGGYPGVV